MACKDQPLHGMYKNDALLRLAGFRRDPRPITAPAPYSDTSAPETVELQMPEPPTVEPKQLSFAVITVVLAFAGTVATVIQTVLAAAS
ncbi:hypothetical protein [Actinomadura sp. DC4]|uniref:hypothetical protein n=1 Tax=Actinomadura sp. DC4 TaxID=3055069 RepID=UPI0025B18DF5|nr:hypothetical protein [Actinomadura sp. DC4]MDN3353394.1 hypothetical protein [Actinomadura sp. DC4]